MTENTPEIKQEEIKTQQKQMSHYLVYVCGIIALLLIGFIAGQSFERARIQHFISWNNNYEKNFFGNQPMPPSRGLPPDSFRSHAILGKILVVEENKISVQDERSKQEQAIIVSDSTVIQFNNSNIQVKDLKPDQKVAIFGQPNSDGQIVASLIRVLDTNAQSGNTNMSPDNKN